MEKNKLNLEKNKDFEKLEKNKETENITKQMEEVFAKRVLEILCKMKLKKTLRKKYSRFRK